MASCRPTFGQIARIAGWAPTPVVGLGDGVYASPRFPVFLAANQQAAVDLCGGLNCRFASHYVSARFGWLPASLFSPDERRSIEYSIREAQEGELHGDAAAAVHSWAQEAVKFAGSLPNSRAGKPCYIFVRSFPGLHEPFPLDRFVVLTDEEVGSAMEAEGKRWASENGPKITEAFRRMAARVTGGPPHRPRGDDVALSPDENCEAEKLLAEVIGPDATADETNNNTAGDGDEPDGPTPPDGFRWKGSVYSPLAKGPYRALEAVWKAKYRCVDASALSMAISDDHACDHLPDNSMPSLRGELNDFFRKYRITLHARVRNRQWLVLKDGPPPKAKGNRKSQAKKRPAKKSRKS